MEKNEDKGNETEERFKDWLNKNNIAYFYIKQDSQSFSSVFKNEKGKRPDFMILVPHFGLIFVDVKNRKVMPNFDTYPIDEEEAKKYSSLQRKFNLQIWYVISNEGFAYKTWLWIPVSKVLEEGIGKKYEASETKEPFFSVKTDNFIQLADDDSLERLFTKLSKK